MSFLLLGTLLRYKNLFPSKKIFVYSGLGYPQHYLLLICLIAYILVLLSSFYLVPTTYKILLTQIIRIWISLFSQRPIVWIKKRKNSTPLGLCIFLCISLFLPFVMNLSNYIYTIHFCVAHGALALLLEKKNH